MDIIDACRLINSAKQEWSGDSLCENYERLLESERNGGNGDNAVGFMKRCLAIVVILITCFTTCARAEDAGYVSWSYSDEANIGTQYTNVNIQKMQVQTDNCVGEMQIPLTINGTSNSLIKTAYYNVADQKLMLERETEINVPLESKPYAILYVALTDDNMLCVLYATNEEEHSALKRDRFALNERRCDILESTTVYAFENGSMLQSYSVSVSGNVAWVSPQDSIMVMDCSADNTRMREVSFEWPSNYFTEDSMITNYVIAPVWLNENELGFWLATEYIFNGKRESTTNARFYVVNISMTTTHAVVYDVDGFADFYPEICSISLDKDTLLVLGEKKGDYHSYSGDDNQFAVLIRLLDGEEWMCFRTKYDYGYGAMSSVPLWK